MFGSFGKKGQEVPRKRIKAAEEILDAVMSLCFGQINLGNSADPALNTSLKNLYLNFRVYSAKLLDSQILIIDMFYSTQFSFPYDFQALKVLPQTTRLNSWNNR